MITCEKALFWDLTKSEVKNYPIRPRRRTVFLSWFREKSRYIDMLRPLDESKFDDSLTNFEEALVSLKMVVAITNLISNTSSL
jgi:hypothetical protein